MSVGLRDVHYVNDKELNTVTDIDRAPVLGLYLFGNYGHNMITF